MQSRRALVTGGAARIGRALALALADRGFDVAVHFSASVAEVHDVVRLIENKGRLSIALQADLLDESQSTLLIDRAAAALGGPIGCLVNNASIFEQDTLETATRESWDRHMDSNLRAPFLLTQKLAAQTPSPIVDDSGEPVAQGLVINMIDQRVHKLTPEFMSYTLAKMGLWAFTRTAAQALAPKVRVNGIGPGPTLQGAHQSDVEFSRQRAATILKRGSNPSDMVAALNYFLDAPAVTGQMINVDGGQHLVWETPDVADER